MKTYILFIFILLSNNLFSQTAPDWSWAKSAGGIRIDQAYTLDRDNDDNIFIAGAFTSAITYFDNIALTNFVNSGNSRDVFIAKYDKNGAVLWANSAGGSDEDRVRSLQTDANGNVIIVGTFASPTITFGNFTLVNASTNDDLFIVKYDSLGNVIWATSAGGISSDRAYGISTDANNNIYVAGHFDSPNITFGNITLNNYNVSNMFVVKYDELGNVIWAKTGGGLNAFTHAYALSCKPNGEVFVAGDYVPSSISFGNLTLNNPYGSTGRGLFIVKYDSSGNEMWVKGGAVNMNIANNIVQLKDIQCDGIGNSYITGLYTGSKLVIDSDTLTSANGLNSNADYFISKFDNNGNLIFNISNGNIDAEVGESITILDTSNFFITGTFMSDSLAMGNTMLYGVNGTNMFVAKCNGNGTPIWAKSIGNGNEVSPTSLVCNNNEDIFVTGYFYSNSVSFGPNTIYSNGSPGPNDIFLAKLGCDLSIINQPTTTTLNIGSTASMVVSSSNPSANYQWQTNLGAGFINLSNGGQYSGATNDTLIVLNVSMTNDNQIFRCIVSIGGCADTSNTALIRIISDQLGLNVVDDTNINIIYPNPTNGIIKILGPKPYKIKVVNFHGEVMLEINNSNQLSLTDFADGNYLIQILDYEGNIKSNNKVVKMQ